MAFFQTLGCPFSTRLGARSDSDLDISSVEDPRAGMVVVGRQEIVGTHLESASSLSTLGQVVQIERLSKDPCWGAACHDEEAPSSLLFVSCTKLDATATFVVEQAWEKQTRLSQVTSVTLRVLASSTMSSSTSTRKLFGGAITIELPSALVDVS